MPSVFDQPTSRPSVRAMWAIIRDVVVLPLVPVTATTGTRGVIVVGAGPGSAAATRAAAALTTASTSPPGTASSTSATAVPITWARFAVPPRERHHDLVLVAGGPHAHGEPGRTRLGRDRPDQPAHRAQREPLPEPGVGAPGPRVAQPDPLREPPRGLLRDAPPAPRCRGSA